MDYKMGGRDLFCESIRKRDKHTCQKCGKIWKEGTRRFDVHHLDENMEGEQRTSTWDREHPDRLITFCHRCHLREDSVSQSMIRGARIRRLRKIGERSK